MTEPPLVLVVNRALASSAGADLLAIPLAAGRAAPLSRGDVPLAPLLPALQRAVLADLTLPLERHRLAALVHSLGERARATGRDVRTTSPNAAQGSRRRAALAARRVEHLADLVREARG